MKNLMRRWICILLVVLLTAALYACGSSEPDPNAGVYTGKSAEMGGIAIDLAEVFGDGFSIELKNGGKAAFNYEGKSYKMKWTLDGTTFHAEGGGAELDGTLSDGVMVLEDVLSSGVSITLER
ncbi:MAG: hypothetical protein J5973_04690 [Eubacterium sp.]|nr:hypothetical protein [Eubacterium sp.]